MKKTLILVFGSLLVFCFAVGQIAAAPTPETATVWVEGEARVSGGSIRDNQSLSGKKCVFYDNNQGTPVTITWNVSIPTTGYYSLQIAGQSVGHPTDAYHSPYYWWFDDDQDSRVHFTGGLDNGREIDRYATNFYWHQCTLGESEYVLLTAGPHTLKVRATENRGYNPQITVNIDAIALTLEREEEEPPVNPAPTPQTSTVWLEGEARASGGNIRENKNLSGDNSVAYDSSQGTPVTITWNVSVPTTGYYSLQIAAQSVGHPTEAYHSPYYWWFDDNQDSKAHFTGGLDNGREMYKYAHNFYWHQCTLGESEYVLLSAGAHTLTVYVDENRGYNPQITVNIDAIALTLKGKEAESRVANVRFSSTKLISQHAAQNPLQISFDVSAGEEENIITKGAVVTIEIYNLRGRLIKVLCDNSPYPVGAGYKVAWYGDDGNGRPVSSGIYFLLIKAIDAMSGQLYKSKIQPINVFYR